MCAFSKGDIITELRGASPGLLFQLNDPAEQSSVLAVAVSDSLSPLFTLGGRYDFAYTETDEDISFLSMRIDGGYWIAAPFNPCVSGTPKLESLPEGAGLPLMIVKVNVADGAVEDSEYVVMGNFFSNLIIDSSNRMLSRGTGMEVVLRAKKDAYERFPSDEDIAKKTEYICTLGRDERSGTDTQ